MKVFAYIRYSSLNQKGNTSVETQRDAIQRFVSSFPDLRGGVIVEKLDEAKSGTTVANRGALAAVLREAIRGDSVVVFKYDRLGRNLLESLQTLRGLEDKGISVYSTTEPNTEVVRNLLLTMAQEFSRQLGERCKRALDARAQAGHAANKPAFGYEIKRETPNGPGKFVIVENAAKVVREIFQMRADEKSLYSITNHLNTRNIQSPRGGLWQVGTVRSILRNETYLGRVASGMRKFKKGHGLQCMRPRHEWIVCEAAHEAIVSAEVWAAVRKLDSGKYDGRKTTATKRTPYLWTGFVKCKHCGANLHRSTCGRAYLGCEGGRKTGRALACMCRYLVQEERFSEAVFKLLVDRLYSPAAVKTFKRQIKEHVSALIGGNAEHLQPLESRYKKLSQQIEAAARRLVHVTEDAQAAFVDELDKLKRERDGLKLQIEQVKRCCERQPSEAEVEQCIDKNLEDLRNIKQVEDVEAARLELANHIEKIELATDGQAWLYPKPGGLLSKNVSREQGIANIPNWHSFEPYVASFAGQLPAYLVAAHRLAS